MRLLKIVFAIATCLMTWAADTNADPFVGTWKMNEKKSSVTSGRLPTNRTMTFERTANGLSVTIKGEGITGSDKLTLILDGKERPADPSPLVRNTGADTVTVERPNSRTLVATFKKSGKVVARQRREVSQDGRTLTTTGEIVTVKGEKSQNFFVYDKQ